MNLHTIVSICIYSNKINLLSHIAFAIVKWKGCHGLQGKVSLSTENEKLEALGIGAKGERYAHWYLRRLGYISLARNYAGGL